MSSALKKTLYFAIPAETELNKSLSKNLILENISLEPLNSINVKPNTELNNKLFNIVNIKLTTDEEETLEYDFEELDEILQERGNSYIQEFTKKIKGSISLSNTETEFLMDKFETDRESRLTKDLNEEQKIVRAGLMNFKKSKNLQGMEATFLVNIFDDIISLKLIDEDTPLGSQRKSLNQIFKDKNFLIELAIDMIEELQVKIVNHRNIPFETELTADEKLAIDIKGIWPDWKDIGIEKKKKEEEQQAILEASKKPRGRPHKNAF